VKRRDWRNSRGWERGRERKRERERERARGARETVSGVGTEEIA